MLSTPKFLIDAYESYRGDKERHGLRIFLFFTLAILISAYSGDLSKGALPAMASAVSVLAGFTFTALFSSSSFSTHDLPEPKDESDREDIKVLKSIISNFRVRSRLFLVGAVISLEFILIVSIPADWTKISHHMKIIGIREDGHAMIVFKEFHDIASFAMVSLTFFVFSELLYLFYRLSESIFAIFDVRKQYLE